MAWAHAANPVLFCAQMRAYPLGLLADLASDGEDLAAGHQDLLEARLDAAAQVVAVGDRRGVDVEAHVEAAVVGHGG